MQSVQHAARSFPRIIGPFINYYSMFTYGMVKEGIWRREQHLEDGNAPEKYVPCPLSLVMLTLL
jgi:hypothetical protein